MKRSRVIQFLAQRCRSLDSRAKTLVREVLLRTPEELKLESVREVFPVYAGAAYGFSPEEWIIILDLNLMNAPFESERRMRAANRQVALAVIALNLAHHALKHMPDRIHSPQAYDEARDLAIKWGFKREIKIMEKKLL